MLLGSAPAAPPGLPIPVAPGRPGSLGAAASPRGRGGLRGGAARAGGGVGASSSSIRARGSPSMAAAELERSGPRPCLPGAACPGPPPPLRPPLPAPAFPPPPAPPARSRLAGTPRGRGTGGAVAEPGRSRRLPHPRDPSSFPLSPSLPPNRQSASARTAPPGWAGRGSRRAARGSAEVLGKTVPRVSPQLL